MVDAGLIKDKKLLDKIYDVKPEIKDSINNELARRQPSMAEKAAAYYDEAQYAKEAALSDYDEACAYEAAALEVLDELGYLD